MMARVWKLKTNNRIFHQKSKTMKAIFTLLLSTLFSFSLLAYDGTRLTVSSAGNIKMRVEVDGRRYNMDDKEIFIRNLRPGYHTVKIYRDKKKNNRWWDFGFGNNRQETVYNNQVYLRRGHHLDILINRFGKVIVDERPINRNDDWYNAEDDRYDGDRDRDRDRDKNKDLDRDDDRDHDSRDPRYDDNYSRVMSDFDFNRAKENLRKEWFENTRMTTAKFIMDRNYFTSQQVKELLELFTFENNKLDLAKYAYGKTVDKRNYYIVNDVFAFGNSKDELARYIRDYR
jgi:hypothetical protein